MNLKWYKSVILASISLLLLTKGLKILQQTVQIAACCNIWVRPGRYDKACLASSHACLSRSLRRF
jgi:hypothetical protein